MFKNNFNIAKCNQTLINCFIIDEDEPSQFLDVFISRGILSICHGM